MKLFLIYSYFWLSILSNLFAQPDLPKSNIENMKFGSIVGSTSNYATSEPVIGATIKVIGTKLGAYTKPDGKFSITNVPVGIYQITISAVGYEPVTISDVVVQSARPATVAASLNAKVLTTDTLVVRAKSFKRTPDVTVSQSKLSAEEIRRLPGGFEDVVRAVSLLPGIAQSQNGRNDLLVRGGAASENLFLIDGIEANNINHFGTQGAGGGPLSFINLDFVRETDFSTGGFSSKFGDKLSSVMKISLRNGREDKHGGKLTLAATQFATNLEGPLTSSGNYLFSARRSYLDFIFKAAGLAFVPEYWDFLVKSEFDINDYNKISALGICVIDKVKQFNETPEQRASNARLLDNTQNQVVSGVTWRHIFEKGYVNSTLGKSLVRFKFKQTDSNGTQNFVNNSLEDEYSLRSDANLALSPNTEIVIGGQLKSILFNTDLFLKKPFGSNLDITLDSVFYKAVFYTNWSQGLGDLRLNLGVRADYFNAIETKFYPTLRASVNYSFDDLTNVSLSAGRYFQHPSYIWLVANAENKKLKDIQADQLVLGFERLLDSDIKASVETYYKKYSNYPASLTRPFLVLANTGTGFNEQDEGFASFGLEPLSSVGSGRSYGIEFLLQKKYSSELPLYGLFSLSYNQSFFTALDGIEKPSDYNQPIILNLSAGYRTGDWEFGGKFRFASGRPYTPIDTVVGDRNYGYRDVSKYNSERLSASHTLDLRIDRYWQFDSSTLITYIDIQNIYNRKNPNIPRFDQTKRVIENGVSAIGILPSIGVSWEF